jgi:hypothetical protein
MLPASIRIKLPTPDFNDYKSLFALMSEAARVHPDAPVNYQQEHPMCEYENCTVVLSCSVPSHRPISKRKSGTHANTPGAEDYREDRLVNKNRLDLFNKSQKPPGTDWLWCPSHGKWGKHYVDSCHLRGGPQTHDNPKVRTLRLSNRPLIGQPEKSLVTAKRPRLGAHVSNRLDTREPQLGTQTLATQTDHFLENGTPSTSDDPSPFSPDDPPKLLALLHSGPPSDGNENAPPLVGPPLSLEDVSDYRDLDEGDHLRILALKIAIPDRNPSVGSPLSLENVQIVEASK